MFGCGVKRLMVTMHIISFHLLLSFCASPEHKHLPLVENQLDQVDYFWTLFNPVRENY